MSGPAPTQPHESKIQARGTLHPRLSHGGCCIVDSYHVPKWREQAMTDYRAKRGVTTKMIDLDCTSAMWRER